MAKADSTTRNKNDPTVKEVYENLGVKKGDIVFIHVNVLPFGLVAENRDEFIAYFLDPLFQTIGAEGTIACLTYTNSYGLQATPYVHEKSSSEAGMLTEYIRTMDGTIRSFHPLMSFAARGPHAKRICEHTTRSAFGWGSPFQKLHVLNAKCLYIGMTCGTSCSFLHYVEQMYGVSHCYNKAFFHPAYKNDVEQKGPFLAFLRNRESTPYDYSRFEKEMRSRGFIKEHTHHGAPLQMIQFNDCFTVGMEMLEKDPCAFIQEPFYVTQ